MPKLFAAIAVGILVLGLGPGAAAQDRAPTVFVTALSAENEVPGCAAGEQSGAAGRATVRIDEDTGEIAYRVVARRLPGTIAGSPGAHIHVGAAEEMGPVVQALELTGRNQGLVATGTATNPALAQAIVADPANYYVNVHTTVCPGGAIRGQLG